MSIIILSPQSESNTFSETSFYFSVTDLSVMARQVNAVLCSAVGSHSTTHCCLHDQSVHTTGKVFIYLFIHSLIYIFFICSGKMPIVVTKEINYKMIHVFQDCQTERCSFTYTYNYS